MKIGMTTRGLCVDRFAPGCDRIIVANAAVTVRVLTGGHLDPPMIEPATSSR